jgi:hypothetical protein
MQKIIGKYRLEDERIIGEGSHGKVYKVVLPAKAGVSLRCLTVLLRRSML